MSGFSFPPPPPPPPKINSAHNENSVQIRGNGRGRGNNFAHGRGTGNAHRGRHDIVNHSERQQSWHRGPPTQASPNGQYELHFPTPDSSNSRSWPGPKNFDQHHFGAQAVGKIPQKIDTPPRTVAGHKRKLEALRGPQIAGSSGPPTAPSVPTFGAPILNQPSPSVYSRPSPSSSSILPTNIKDDASKSAPRKSNALGLTPGEEPHYSSSEHEADDQDADEDVDEEAMFAELGTKLTFEHNGSIIALSSPADLARWKSERLKNFPTRTRMAAKVDEKRAMGDMRKRLLFEAAGALRTGNRTAPQISAHPSNPHSSHDLVPAKDILGSKGTDSITKVEASSNYSHEPTALQARDTGSVLVDQPSLSKDLSETAVDENAAPHVKAAVEEAGNASDEKDAQSESDDGAPESVSSKQPVKSSGEHLPAHKPRDERSISRPKKPIRSVASHVEKRGIYQALIEQEQHGQHVLALAVIKSLGKAGFFTCSE